MIKGSTHPGLQRKVVPFKTNDASIKCVSSGSVKIWTSKKPHWIHIHFGKIHFGPQEVLLCSTALKYLCFSASSLGVSMAFCSWEIPKKNLPQTHTSDGRSWFTYTWSSGNFWFEDPSQKKISQHGNCGVAIQFAYDWQLLPPRWSCFGNGYESCLWPPGKRGTDKKITHQSDKNI